MDSVDVSLLEGHLVGEEEDEEGDVISSDNQHAEQDGTDTSAEGLEGKGGEVASWLISLNLGNLVTCFYSQGYDDLDVIRELDEKDLDALGIDKPGIRKKLLLYAAKLSKSSKPSPLPAIPAAPKPISSQPQPAQQQLAPPTPLSKKNRSPYRCSKCCMFKVQSINKHNSHKCDEKLIGHTWETCPTHNLRAHPEEQENRRKKRAEDRKKKKEENKKHKVDRKRKQDLQKEHPLVAIDWDTFREEELRRIIKANPERYSKDMEGQRLMEAMLIIIARYNELKEMVEQVKNKKRKVVSSPPVSDQQLAPMTMQDVLDPGNQLAMAGSIHSLPPGTLLPQQLQLDQLQQQHDPMEHQHKFQQLQHLQQLQLQQQRPQKQHDPLQIQQTLQGQQLHHQQRLAQQPATQALLQQRQQLLVQQQMMHHQAPQIQTQQHSLLQPVVLQPGMVNPSQED